MFYIYSCAPTLILLYSYTPKYTISGFHTIGGEAAMEEYDICMGANLTCMNDHLNWMGKQLLFKVIASLNSHDEFIAKYNPSYFHPSLNILIRTKLDGKKHK